MIWVTGPAGGLGRAGSALWQRSVEVDPTFAQGWVNVASGEHGLNQSLSLYRRALQLQPGLVEAWINIGQVRSHPSLYKLQRRAGVAEEK